MNPGLRLYDYSEKDILKEIPENPLKSRE